MVIGKGNAKIRGRAKKVFQLLSKKYSDVPKLFLSYKTQAQMLCAIILSAQSTDVQTNKVTRELFLKHKTVSDFADADLSKLEREINSIGLYRSKARNIIFSFKIIKEKFGGKIPQTMGELLELPGVGRKTANLVLFSLGKIEGVAVDTHVARLSYRIGLSSSKNPSIIEKDLMNIYPKKNWGKLNGLFISHGREVCLARIPKCSNCFLNTAKLCPRAGVSKSV
ncbi:MAG: endonuclease III [archaeon]|jgi:endonuclease-3